MNTFLLFLRKYTKIFCLLLVLWGGNAFGQTVLAGWDFSSLAGGINNFGTSPLSATTVAANLSIGALSRGSGIGTTGSGAANAWGGTEFRAASSTKTTAISDNEFATLTISANTGFAFSLSSISAYNIRRSSTGPTTGIWQYQINSGSFIDIGTDITWGTTTTAAGNAQAAIDLSGITALQNIASGTTITLRCVTWGATAAGGTWYINDPSDTTANDLIVNGTVTSAGKVSTGSGDWNTAGTWNPVGVPSDTDNVIIAPTHTVFTTTSLTRNASTTVNGTFELRDGGYADGTGTFTYGTAGTLNFNTNEVYGVNDNHKYWPVANGPVNVNVFNLGMRLLSGADRTVNGTFAIGSGGITGLFLNGSAALRLNGICRINAGGFFNNSPIFGSSATLIYNSGGTFNRGIEWSHVGVGTIGTTPGYPNNVQLSNNTIFNYNNGTPSSKAIAGNLTIDSGSSFFMDFGSAASGGSLIVKGNVDIKGTFTLGFAVGDDLEVGGNWNRVGTFNPNYRLVTFNGTAAQTLTGATAFNFLTLNNSNGLTLQASSAVTVTQTLALTSGKITLGTNNLTIGGTGTIINFDASKYVVTNGTGQLKRTVGSSNVLFPVGKTAYNPITFNNAGTSDIYGVRVENAATAGTYPTKTVTRQWITTEDVAGGSNLSIVAQYNTGETGPGFAAATDYFIGHYNGSIYTQQVASNFAGSNPFTVSSNSNLTPPDLTIGTQYFAIGKDNAFLSTATNLVITGISPTSPSAGNGFTVTVRAQDAYGAFTNVIAATAFSLTTNGNAGAISGTVTGTIAAGTSTVTISGVILPNAGTNVTLTATRTTGDVLAPGTSTLFIVLGPATKLMYGTAPPATGIVNTNLTSFTVQALRLDNTLDTFYTGTITIAKAGGSGLLSGTLTANAVAGIATFTSYQFNAVDTYTIEASATGLTTVTSGNIVITTDPTLGYFRSNVTTGTWNTPGSWQTSSDGSTNWITSTVVPTSAATAITIRFGNTINVTAVASAKLLSVDAGGIITVNSGLTLVGATTINGTWNQTTVTAIINSGAMSFTATGIYNHNTNGGTIPVASWNVASNCNIIGFTNSGIVTGPSGLAQTFGNLTFNNPGSSNFINLFTSNSSITVNGTFTVGPSSSNQVSFGNSALTATAAINKINVTGGFLNGVGATAILNLNVTTDLVVEGTGVFRLASSSGKANITVLNDVLLKDEGLLEVVAGSGSTVVAQLLDVKRDFIINGTFAKLHLKPNGNSSAKAEVYVGRNFSSNNTGFEAVDVDFGVGTVSTNQIRITGNLTHTGTGVYQTRSNSIALGFVFRGSLLSPSQISYSGENSDFTSYEVDTNYHASLLTDLVLGSSTLNPISSFTVKGTLNFNDKSIVGNIRARFNTVAAASLITSNSGGFGGTVTNGSLKSFGSIGMTAADGRAQFILGTNYTFNANTITPFPTGTFGNPQSLTFNDAVVTSNSTSTLTIIGAVNINGISKFSLNPTNNNSLALGGIMTIEPNATFDNGGENQITNGGGSIIINGTFITRNAQGFRGTNTAIPAILPTLGSNSVVEYGLNGNQIVTAFDYKNLTFSNGGTKSFSNLINVDTNGLVKITGNTTVDADNNLASTSANNTGLTMDGGRLILRTGGTQPNMRGTYTLTGGVIEFAGTSAKTIRSPQSYLNIEVTGTNVSNGLGNTTLFNGGTFIVKPTGIFTINDDGIVGAGTSETLIVENGGTFRTGATDGFNGGTNTSVRNSIETIVLQNNSIVEYSSSNNQTITAIIPGYKKLKVSGTSGVKTLGTTLINVEEDLNVTGSLLKIEDGKTLKITNAVSTISTDATKGILIENNGSLVQVTEVNNAMTNNNTGNIKMERISQPMIQNDYTYWSSPVQGFILNGVSPTTSVTKFFKWDEVGQGWVAPGSTTHLMEAGRGYIVRAPGTYASPTATIANFIGKPNNGVVNMNVKGSTSDVETGFIWNLIGNPYPSAIDADVFLNLNATKVDGTIYLWTHNTPLNPGLASGYTPNDYASWNGVGGTDTKAAISGLITDEPKGFIAAGQSFFIRGINPSSSQVTFNNSMRVDGTNNKNSQFFRGAAVTAQNPTTTEKHRVWLNLTGAQNAFNQTLVGYVNDATNDYDLRFDGVSFGGNKVTFYSVLNTKNLVIQGRALPFSNLDTVPLGYNTTLTGNLTISIDHVDGFMETQGIYLKDNLLNVEHDLKASNYTFATVPGTFNSRFVLRYIPEAQLGNPSFEQQVKGVRIYKNNATLNVSSPYETIATVSVYDIAGRLVFEQKDCNTNRFESSTIFGTPQALIVKVTLKNGAVVTDKVL